MKAKNLKQFKSTLLGLVFIGVGIYLLIKGISTDIYLIGGLEIGGVLLFFTGDKFIEQLEKVVFGKILFEKKNDVE
jgi:hypothetical protein